MSHNSKAHFLLSTQLYGNANSNDRHMVAKDKGFFGGESSTLSLGSVTDGSDDSASAVMSLDTDNSQATPIPVKSKIIKASMSSWAYGHTNPVTVYLWRRTVPAGSTISQPMTLVGYYAIGTPTSSGWDQNTAFTFTSSNEFSAGDWFSVSFKRPNTTTGGNFTMMISCLFAEL